MTPCPIVIELCAGTAALSLCLLGMLAETGDYVSLVRAQDRQWWAAGALTLPRAESGGCAGEALAEVLLAAWGPV